MSVYPSTFIQAETSRTGATPRSARMGAGRTWVRLPHTGLSKTLSVTYIGYGIVEVSEDGDFVVTKPAGTGGVVSRLSVGEQMLYEVLDPANYLLPVRL